MSIFGKLFGGGGSTPNEVEPVEYNGFKIVPEPMKEGGTYRIAARIEKEIDGEVKTHPVDPCRHARKRPPPRRMTATDRSHFTLTVVTSADGYIARSTTEPPQAWASPEEQALFFEDVNSHDWAIMGRHTHEAADRPDRHRIVFSRQLAGWRRPSQLWIDPAEAVPDDLSALVASRRPLRSGLILGGTRVHDWFLRHEAIDRVHLTVEPVRFGGGLPVFSGSDGKAPAEIFTTAGFFLMEERVLNAQATVWTRWERRAD